MIAILNDDILEENETFSVVLSTNDQDVDISQSQSTVTIANDDGTYIYLQLVFGSCIVSPAFFMHACRCDIGTASDSLYY